MSGPRRTPEEVLRVVVDAKAGDVPPGGAQFALRLSIQALLERNERLEARVAELEKRLT